MMLIFVQPLSVHHQLTHATHHLATIGSITTTCCWVQEQLHIAVLRETHKQLWTSSLEKPLKAVVSKWTVSKLTHVGCVFGHGCHSIFVRCKFYICLTSYPPIWANLNMDSHRIQWREELKWKHKGQINPWLTCLKLHAQPKHLQYSQKMWDVCVIHLNLTL